MEAWVLWDAASFVRSGLSALYVRDILFVSYAGAFSSDKGNRDY